MTMPKGIVFKASVLDRRRASWKKLFAKDPDGIRQLQRAYQARFKSRLLAESNQRARQYKDGSLKKYARVIFRGVATVMEISCKNCGEAFIIRPARTNAYPRYCPVCSYIRNKISQKAYEERNAKARKNRQKKK